MDGIRFEQCVLVTARIRLRPFRFDDADQVIRLLGDFDVSKTLARVPYPYTAEDARDWLSRIVVAQTVGRADFAVDVGDGAIGGIGLREVDGVAQIGFWLAKSHWGQGLMSEGASAVLAWLFDTTGHDLVEAGVFEGNPASLRIQEKLGFDVTGTSMHHCLAQGKDMPHIDTVLKRNRFRPLAQ